MEKVKNPRNAGRKEKGLYKNKICGMIEYKKFAYKGKYVIYGLASTSEENKIEYIGFTSLGLNIRYNLHVSLRHGTTKKEQWVREVLESNNKLILIVLKDGIATRTEACKLETQQIKKYGAKRILKNSTMGGLGKPGYVTPEMTKKKQSESTTGRPKKRTKIERE